MDAFITRRGGAGGGLNFKVVGGTIQPSNPKENTIWVNTPNEISGWGFGPEADKPATPATGMVWFVASDDSFIKFNALKDDTIIVTPICAYQYTSGAWESIGDVKIYQNSEWVDWWDGSLYDAGKQYESVTGGWLAAYPFSNYSEGGTTTLEANRIKMVAASGGAPGAFPKNSIDLTRFTKLHVAHSGNGIRVTFANKFPCVFPADTIASYQCVASTDSAIDIPTGVTKCMVAINTDATSYVTKVWLT